MIKLRLFNLLIQDRLLVSHLLRSSVATTWISAAAAAAKEHNHRQSGDDGAQTGERARGRSFCGFFLLFICSRSKGPAWIRTRSKAARRGQALLEQERGGRRGARRTKIGPCWTNARTKEGPRRGEYVLFWRNSSIVMPPEQEIFGTRPGDDDDDVVFVDILGLRRRARPLLPGVNPSRFPRCNLFTFSVLINRIMPRELCRPPPTGPGCSGATGASSPPSSPVIT